jgi:hypothetical protein
VTEAEFLRRIDHNIELSREHMARGGVLMARLEEKMDQVTEEIKLSRESHVDLRAFIRDINRRNELVWREVRDGFREMRADFAEMRADVSDQFRAQTAEIWAQTAEIKAQTAAIFKVLDQLGPQEG